MSRDMRDMQLSASLDPCDPLDMRDMQIDYQKEEKNYVSRMSRDIRDMCYIHITFGFLDPCDPRDM